MFVGEESGKKVEAKKEKAAKENLSESIESMPPPEQNKKLKADEEPIFESDDEEQEKPVKRSTRKK